jgi:hypothetical protein
MSSKDHLLGSGHAGGMDDLSNTLDKNIEKELI